ncbi:MAG: hypothetical protein ABIO72_01035 [Patescibacteria group bacterium]
MSVHGWKGLYITAGILFLQVFLFAQPAKAEVIKNTWLTDSIVNAMVLDTDGTAYLGGSFTYIAPFYGQSVAFDLTTASANASFPKFNGRVMSVISDGSGGWYVGGGFTYANEVARNNLAHVFSDGSLDTSWNPNVTVTVGANSGVKTMLLSGTTLYIGGEITAVGGVSRSIAAAVNTGTGLATSWNPNVTGTTVLTFELATSTIFLGGTFTAAGGVSRTNLTELNVTSGSSTGWNGTISGGDVRDLKVFNGLLYVGGNFTSAGGSTRNRLAALSLTTGSSTSWNPNASNFINSMAFSTSTVYVGGNFITIGGQSRNRLAELNLTSGSSTSWNPNVGNTITDMSLVGSSLYVAGTITSIGGLSRLGVAEISTASGSSTSWDPLIRTGDANAFAISGSTLLAGFSALPQPPAVGVTNRSRLLSLDSSGVLTSWNPNASGTVSTMVLTTSTVLVGGAFTAIGGDARNRLAEISKTTASSTSWNPNANNSVTRMLMDGNTLYIGGTFTTIGGASRSELVALDYSSASPTAWNPNVAGGQVSTIATGTSSIYVGGTFTSVGGVTRNRIAEIDISSASPTAWNPNAGGTVNDILIYNNLAYVGGVFTTIGGQTRNRAAAIDLTTGLANSWNPNLGATVQKILNKGSVMILSGSFTTVGGLSRSYLASVDPVSALLTGWNPAINAPFQAAGGSAITMAPYGNTVYAFGNSGGGQFYTPLLQFSATTGSGAESGSPSLTFELSEQVSTPITITLSTSGTATFNTDYSIPSIVFPANQLSYSVPLTLLNDSLVEGNETAILTILSASPTSTQFNNNTTFTYTIIDDDTAGLSVTQSGGTTQVTEGAGSSNNDTISLVLTSQPTADVTVTLGVSSTISIFPATITFTNLNWNVAQDVTVSAIDDTTIQGTHSAGISFSLTSGDLTYNGLAVPLVGVTVFDNDPVAGATSGGGGGGLGAPEVSALPPLVTNYQSTQPIVLPSKIPAYSLIKLPSDGDTMTQVDSAVYLMGDDQKRHAFPNEKVYFSWYMDFSGVQIVGPDQLSQIPLGKNMTYKPGSRLVKFLTDPKVYRVEAGGVLNWIPSEEIAVQLYGPFWNTLIDDISDAFYNDYTFATP